MDTEHDNQNVDKALELLRLSLTEAQNTVRSYDAKAQIVGIGYIFALGIISQFRDAIPTTTVAGVGFVLVAWFVVILPIVLFGSVLYPTRKIAPRIVEKPPESLRSVLYIDPHKVTSVEEIKDSALSSEALDEVGYELLRVSHLREVKRVRFISALCGAALCFGFLFASQLAQVL